jgi:hypothetical protein
LPPARRNELFHLIRQNDEQTIRLVPVAGNFGEKLIWRHACRSGDTDGVGNPGADFTRNQGRAAMMAGRLTDIEIRFIQR